MARRLKDDPNNRYLTAYTALEDEERKRDFRQEMCHEYNWTKATFYNRLHSEYYSPAERATFERLIRIYSNRC